MKCKRWNVKICRKLVKVLLDLSCNRETKTEINNSMLSMLTFMNKWQNHILSKFKTNLWLSHRFPQTNAIFNVKKVLIWIIVMDKFEYFYFILNYWKVTPAIYQHLNDFTGKLNFRYLSRPTQLRISKPSWEHFPNWNLRQIGLGVPKLWS